jgi:hypothetical protein
VGRELKRKPLDGEATRRRVEAALLKAERGEDLTKKELRIVQWVTRPGGCRACYAPQQVSRGRGWSRR